MLGNGFRTNQDVIVDVTTACACMTTHWVCGKFNAESFESVEMLAQTKHRGSKLLENEFWTKHDVLVAITTACATITTHWVCGEFDVESCDSVETVAQKEKGGQNRLAMVFGRNMTSLLL